MRAWLLGHGLSPRKCLCETEKAVWGTGGGGWSLDEHQCWDKKWTVPGEVDAAFLGGPGVHMVGGCLRPSHPSHSQSQAGSRNKTHIVCSPRAQTQMSPWHVLPVVPNRKGVGWNPNRRIWSEEFPLRKRKPPPPQASICRIKYLHIHTYVYLYIYICLAQHVAIRF